MNDETGESKVKSLVKAMRVLESFSVDTREMGVSEIASRLGYQKSTVFNILSTFSDLGYVEQNHETGKYFLSLKILHFSYIVNSHLGFQRVFQEPMNRISAQTGEICYMGIPNGDKVLYLLSTAPSGSANLRQITGETAPMYCTGLGKVFLAYMSHDERQQVLSKPSVKFTDNTIIDRAALEANLEEVRRNGFAVDNMEHEFGIRCVAVPVFGVNNQVMAAVSVSGPSPRFDPVQVLEKYKIITTNLESLQYRL